MTSFYSNGKLLLTGEYAVLDGAMALALPTKFGQSLHVESIAKPKVIWKSLDEKGNIWYEEQFKLQNNEISLFVRNDNKISSRLLEILSHAKQLNPEFLRDSEGYRVTTALDFPKNWGLGSSSTLIHNIASWASIDPFNLLELTFGGSGYDIACAQHDTAITYQLETNNRHIKVIDFFPDFTKHLYFVHLNKKQNSREGIAQYKKNDSNLEKEIKEISTITQNMIRCNSLHKFEELITKHENIISRLIDEQPIKKRLFNDFNGSIKSLGAWGGDFILVASKEDPTTYFKDKGYGTILRYSKMIL